MAGEDLTILINKVLTLLNLLALWASVMTTLVPLSAFITAFLSAPLVKYSPHSFRWKEADVKSFT